MRDTVGNDDVKPLNNSSRYTTNKSTVCKPHEQFLMKEYKKFSTSFVPGDLVFVAFSNYSWPAVVTQVGDETLEVVTLVLEQDEIISKDRAAMYEGVAQLNSIISVLTPGEKLDFEEAADSLMELSKKSRQERLEQLKNDLLGSISGSEECDNDSTKENLIELNSQSHRPEQNVAPKPDFDMHDDCDPSDDSEIDIGVPSLPNGGEVRKLSCDVNDVILTPVRDHLKKIMSNDAGDQIELNKNASQDQIISPVKTPPIPDCRQLEQDQIISPILDAQEPTNSPKMDLPKSPQKIETSPNIDPPEISPSVDLPEISQNVDLPKTPPNIDLPVTSPKKRVKGSKSHRKKHVISDELMEIKLKALEKARATRVALLAAKKAAEEKQNQSVVDPTTADVDNNTSLKSSKKGHPKRTPKKKATKSSAKVAKSVSSKAAKPLKKSSEEKKDRVDNKDIKSTTDDISPVQNTTEKKVKNVPTTKQVQKRARRASETTPKPTKKTPSRRSISAAAKESIKTETVVSPEKTPNKINEIVHTSEIINPEQTKIVIKLGREPVTPEATVKPKKRLGRPPKNKIQPPLPDDEKMSTDAAIKSDEVVEHIPPEVSSTQKPEQVEVRMNEVVSFLSPYYVNLFNDLIKEQLENQIKLDVEALTGEEKQIITKALDKKVSGKIKKEAYGIISKLVKNSPCQQLLKDATKPAEHLPEVGPGTPPASPKQEPLISNNIKPYLNQSNRKITQDVVHNPFPVSLIEINETTRKDYLESKGLNLKYKAVPPSWSAYMRRIPSMTPVKVHKSPKQRKTPAKSPKWSKRMKLETPESKKGGKQHPPLAVKKLAVLFRIKDIQKTVEDPLELTVDGIKWGDLTSEVRAQYIELAGSISALPPDTRFVDCLALDLYAASNHDATRLSWTTLPVTKRKKFLAEAKKMLKTKAPDADEGNLKSHNDALVKELLDLESRKRKRSSTPTSDTEPSAKKEKGDGSTILDFLCIDCFTLDYNPKLFTTCTSCHAPYHRKCIGSEVEECNKDIKPKYLCSECLTGAICSLCRKGDNLTSCSKCRFKYHNDCVRPHMSTQIVSDTSFICPYHVCGSCEARPESSIRNFVRCVRCPLSFHENHLPAGCMRISKSHILCYRHCKGFGPAQKNLPKEVSKKKRKRGSLIPKKYKQAKLQPHVNVPFCFQCTFGGDLICCEECPASFHNECVPEDNRHSEGALSWLCPDCIVGKKPFIGDIIWVKFGFYRWWPCQILDEMDLPDNIFAKPHKPCQFPVICLGTKEFAWIDMERVYSFEDGDKGSFINTTSGITNSFKLAIVEAKDLHNKVKSIKDMLLQEIATVDHLASKKPAPFRFIKVNSAYSTAMKEYEKQLRMERMPFPCDCTIADKCSADSSCINRVLLVECPPSCKWGDECENQRFQHRQYPATKLVKTEARGWGLVTCENISTGVLVHEYVGEIIDEAEVHRRLDYYQSTGITDYYMLTVENSRVIDAKPKANNARFMNHSCDPNCETRKWNVCGLTCIGLFAKRPIPTGEELTFDYQFDTRGQEKKVCLCGSQNCSGYLGVPARKIVLQEAKKVKKKKKRKRRIKLDLDGKPVKPRRRKMTKKTKQLDIKKELADAVSATSESVSVNTESVSGETGSVSATTDSTSTPSESTSAVSESVSVKTESVSDKTESVSVDTESNAATVESVSVDAESNAATTESVSVASESILAESETIPGKTESVSTASETMSAEPLSTTDLPEASTIGIEPADQPETAGPSKTQSTKGIKITKSVRPQTKAALKKAILARKRPPVRKASRISSGERGIESDLQAVEAIINSQGES